MMNRRDPRRAGKGQAITELALLTPLIVTMLLGIVELAGAYGAKMTLQAATAQAARIGAIQGNNGNSSSSCPYAANSDLVDQNILNAVLSTHGINPRNVQRIDVYKSDLNGHATNNLVNIYAPPYASASPFASAAPYNWPSCNRSEEPADSLGVHVTYQYHPLIPLPGMGTITMDDYTVQRINPGKGISPCPAADPPSDVVAHWDTTQAEPTATDIITWTAVPGATSYDVYADVNGTGLSSAPVLTINNPPSSGTVVATYTGNSTFAPAAYAVRGHNFCGDGDLSSEAINYQPPLPIAPTIITATASTVTPASDYISWTSVPGAVTYTVTMTPSVGSAQRFTVMAPLTATTIADLYTAPATVAYAVSATSASNVSGPAATAVVTPTAIDDTAFGAGKPFTYAHYPSGAGSWAHCTASGGTGCATVNALTPPYSSSYNGSVSWSSTITDTVDYTFTGSTTSRVQVYGPQWPNGGQAYAWITSTPAQTATVPGSATVLDFYNATVTAPAVIATLPVPGTGTQYLHVRVKGPHSGGCGSTCKYVGIDAVNVLP